MHAPEREVAKYRGKYDSGYEPARRARYERMRRLGLLDECRFRGDDHSYPPKRVYAWSWFRSPFTSVRRPSGPHLYRSISV